jgi:uncharacterized protein (DUF697 family)
MERVKQATTPPTRFTETLRRILDGEFDEANQSEKDEAANDLARAAEVAVSVVTLQPLPFLDPAFITPIQVGLIRGLGRARGYTLDRPAALDLLHNFGMTLVTQHLVIGAAKFVPTLGTIAAVSMAHALTRATGEVCNDYFREGCMMPPDEMHEEFERRYHETLGATYRQKWAEFRTMLYRRRIG